MENISNNLKDLKALVQTWTGFTRAGAQTVIDRFIELDVLTTKDKDKKYGQSYVYKEYLDLFSETKKA